MAELFDNLAGRTRFHTFVQYLILFCSQPEAASDSGIIPVRFVRRPIVPVKYVIFGDPGINRSREIPPEAIELAFSTVFPR